MKAVVVALVSFALIVALAALFSLPVMLFWNWVGVDVLSLRPIGWLQAWGLLVLSGLLFRSSSTAKEK